MKSNGLTIGRQPARDADVSPLLYGNFIEFIDDLTSGMIPELIRNPCFAALHSPPRYYHSEKDFDVDPWKTFAYKRELASRYDAESPWCGERSLRLTLEGKGVSEFAGITAGFAGVKHDPIGIRAGEAYRVEVSLRCAPECAGKMKLNVTLGQELGGFIESFDQKQINHVSRDWRKVVLTLKSKVNAEAELILWTGDECRFWVGRVSMVPLSDPGPFRKDVLAAVRELKPGIIRFGGSSMQHYNWKLGLDPADRRDPFLNEPWDETESGAIGFLEFLEFCRLTGAEPLICTNWNQGDPRENAEWVEYCNGSTDTPMGALRASHGHRKPFNVKLWQIGNEVNGLFYERTFLEFCKAMKAADPNISLLTSYPSEELLKTAGELVDYTCPHYYEDSIPRLVRSIAEMRAMLAREHSTHPVKVAVTEWCSSTGGGWGPERIRFSLLRSALHCARMLHVFQRECDIVRIANYSNLVNSFCGGAIMTRPGQLVKRPIFHVLSLFANNCGRIPLTVEGDFKSEAADVNATMNRQGDIVITAVNSTTRGTTIPLRLRGFDNARWKKEVQVMKGSSLDEINSFAVPDRLKVEKLPGEKQAGHNRALELPPFSFSVVKLLATR